MLCDETDESIPDDYQCFPSPPTDDGWEPVGKCHPTQEECADASCGHDSEDPCIVDPYNDFHMPLINEIITLECFNSGRFNQLFQFSGIDLTDATAQMVSGGGNVGSESYQSLLISFRKR